jgi:hypothetical protein
LTVGPFAISHRSVICSALGPRCRILTGQRGWGGAAVVFGQREALKFATQCAEGTSVECLARSFSVDDYAKVATSARRLGIVAGGVGVARVEGPVGASFASAQGKVCLGGLARELGGCVWCVDRFGSLRLAV